MNTPVIANEVKQSMTSKCMDCRATLAVTSQTAIGPRAGLPQDTCPLWGGALGAPGPPHGCSRSDRHATVIARSVVTWQSRGPDFRASTQKSSQIDRAWPDARFPSGRHSLPALRKSHAPYGYQLLWRFSALKEVRNRARP